MFVLLSSAIFAVFIFGDNTRGRGFTFSEKNLLATTTSTSVTDRATMAAANPLLAKSEKF